MASNLVQTGSTVRLRGYREFMRAAQKAEKETKKVIHFKLREAADIVKVESRHRFDRYDVRSASGFRIRSRIGGVFVEQSLRKTTGLRRDYGELQIDKALVPAMDAKHSEVEQRLEQALEELADIMED